MERIHLNLRSCLRSGILEKVGERRLGRKLIGLRTVLRRMENVLDKGGNVPKGILFEIHLVLISDDRNGMDGQINRDGTRIRRKTKTRLEITFIKERVFLNTRMDTTNGVAKIDGRVS